MGPRLLLAALLAAGPAGTGMAQTQAAAVQMAEQKALMLQSFLGSDRVEAARAADPEAAEVLVRDARDHLAEGRAALEAERPAEATAAFDKGLAALSRAMQLGRGKTEAKAPPPGTPDYDERRGQTASYVAVLEHAEGLSDTETAQLEAIRQTLAAADARRAEGAHGRAAKMLDAAYMRAVALVSEVQEGRTHFVSRTFETAEEALDYERARNENYRLLVELALAERGEFQPGLATLAANLGSLSDRLRAEAEGQAAAGETADAVETMQRATDRLLAILRAAGLVVTQ